MPENCFALFCFLNFSIHCLLSVPCGLKEKRRDFAARSELVKLLSAETAGGYIVRIWERERERERQRGKQASRRNNGESDGLNEISESLLYFSDFLLQSCHVHLLAAVDFHLHLLGERLNEAAQKRHFLFSQFSFLG